ncbi:hypothetical protein [Streptomyces neyagawaensis]|uniref:hypothetical protein n=1 Tax=Streptomyces neyagawaensis TaxID=42238 RepID=UPI0007C74E2C|nr:hypothetical protein [Streptomyces neyagawaensis]MCL6738716.1 hypothetical protein [Streptomyces neyagawaensis]MDE1688603.1 hypothetical protein [Streptomyces neyagawaensis]
MSDDIPVIPEEVPEFTGNLELLDQHISGIRSAGTSLKDSGSAIDTRFGGLSAYYKAPEADQLFATTAPVAAKGEEFSTELGTVASALDDYAAAVGPLKQKFEQLRRDAIAFRAKIADDDEWRADGDLVEENNNRRSDINAAYAAFQAAERDCYNKIVALVGGEPLVVNDGSNKENMYGYRGEDLDHAGGLPWGDPVEESNPWYYIHEHVWDFAVGFVVDGVWGTIKGLGTLVGFSGWDAAGQAWTGLGKLLTGIAITATPLGAAYWLTPADKLPSWLRDSRTAVVETGKALIAYDEWGKNPSRAAGAVTFNVVTTIFTGGAGGAVSGAGKAGAIAKAISFAGKAGRIVDPMTYITKGVGATAVKISDVMASLRGITDGTHIRLGEGTYRIADTPNLTDELPAGLNPENSVRMETPKGEVVYLDTKTLIMHNADGTVRESLDGIKHEGTAAERGAEVRTPEQELVGAGARVGDGSTAAGRVGDDLSGTARVGDDLGGTGRVGDNGLPGGRADDLGRGPSASHEPPTGPRDPSTPPPHGDGPTANGHADDGARPGTGHEPGPVGHGDDGVRQGGHGDGHGSGSHADDGTSPHGQPDGAHHGDRDVREPGGSIAEDAARRAAPPTEIVPGQPLPPAGPGTKILGQVPPGRVETVEVNGYKVITKVDGKNVEHFLKELGYQRAASYLEAKELGTFPRKQTGACAGPVMDLRTGIVAEGINGKATNIIPPDHVHPTIAARYGEIGDPPPGPDHPLGHAEVKAVNELLWERQKRGLPDGEEALADMIASIEFPYLNHMKTGLPVRPAAFCVNCHHMLHGVDSLHGRFTGSPPTDDNWIPQ